MPFRSLPAASAAARGLEIGGAVVTTGSTWLIGQVGDGPISHGMAATLIVGICSTIAPSLIRTLGEAWSARRNREYAVEDRQYQSQLDALNARAAAHSHRADLAEELVKRLRDRVAELEALPAQVAANAAGTARAAGVAHEALAVARQATADRPPSHAELPAYGGPAAPGPG